MRVSYFLSKKDLSFSAKELKLVEKVNEIGRAFNMLGP